jgi:broad specificity phosphatase PhoE
MLNDLHAGKIEGLTFAEIYRVHGEEMAMRQQNPVYFAGPDRVENPMRMSSTGYVL